MLEFVKKVEKKRKKRGESKRVGRQVMSTCKSHGTVTRGSPVSLDHWKLSCDRPKVPSASCTTSYHI